MTQIVITLEALIETCVEYKLKIVYVKPTGITDNIGRNNKYCMHIGIIDIRSSCMSANETTLNPVTEPIKSLLLLLNAA